MRSMENKRVRKRNVPVRSAMSDEELSSLLKRAKEEHPEEFEYKSGGDDTCFSNFLHKSSVAEVISKWL